MMKVFAKGLSFLPLAVLYVWAKILAWVASKIVEYRKSVVIENLSRSFPEKNQTEIAAIASRFYAHLSEVVVESLKGISISQAQISKRVQFKNAELLTQRIASGESVLVLTSHYCNWEWILLGFSAQYQVPIFAVYQSLTNPQADALMLSMRSKFGAKLIVDSKIMRELISNRNLPKVVAVVADQTPRPKDKQLDINFLHQSTPFFLGPQVMAQYMSCRVFYADMQKIGTGFYKVDFIELNSIENPNRDEIMLNFSKSLEKSICREPAFWLWSHKRWKYAQKDA